MSSNPLNLECCRLPHIKRESLSRQTADVEAQAKSNVSWHLKPEGEKSQIESHRRTVLVVIRRGCRRPGILILLPCRLIDRIKLLKDLGVSVQRLQIA